MKAPDGGKSLTVDTNGKDEKAATKLGAKPEKTLGIRQRFLDIKFVPLN